MHSRTPMVATQTFSGGCPTETKRNKHEATKQVSFLWVRQWCDRRGSRRQTIVVWWFQELASYSEKKII